MTEIAIEFIS